MPTPAPRKTCPHVLVLVCAPAHRQLMHSLLPFLRQLSGAPDVRPELAAAFSMPEYFARHGYCLYEDASGFLTAAATIISS